MPLRYETSFSFGIRICTPRPPMGWNTAKRRGRRALGHARRYLRSDHSGLTGSGRTATYHHAGGGAGRRLRRHHVSIFPAQTGASLRCAAMASRSHLSRSRGRLPGLSRASGSGDGGRSRHGFLDAKTERLDVTKALYLIAEDLDTTTLLAEATSRNVAATTTMLATAADADFENLLAVASTMFSGIAGSTRIVFERGASLFALQGCAASCHSCADLICSHLDEPGRATKMGGKWLACLCRLAASCS